MGEIFKRIYCLLEDLFGRELADYLSGISTNLQVDNKFLFIGIIVLAISAVICITFYYVINKPRFNNVWAWLITSGINFVINLCVGYGYVMSDYRAGKMMTIDPQTNEYVDLAINGWNLWGFGLTNAILSALFLFILSMCIKWGSRNCSHAPF